MREFCEFYANFVGLCVDLNPFREFPHIMLEREPSNFRGDCTVNGENVKYKDLSFVTINEIQDCISSNLQRALVEEIRQS